MAPVVHGLEDKYGQHLNFVYIDIDDPDSQPLQEQLGYSTRWRPFIFFVNEQGEIVGDALIGYQEGAVLESTLQQFLVEQGLFTP
jgi:thiol-disulfide isomerase/thioredoxin